MQESAYNKLYINAGMVYSFKGMSRFISLIASIHGAFTFWSVLDNLANSWLQKGYKVYLDVIESIYIFFWRPRIIFFLFRIASFEKREIGDLGIGGPQPTKRSPNSG